MTTKRYYRLLNQHCKTVSKNQCAQCWFKEICIYPPRMVTDEMVEAAEKKLSESEKPKRKDMIRIVLLEAGVAFVVSVAITALLLAIFG